MPAFSFPEACPRCGEPSQMKWDKHPDQTRYKCGSTTMMLAEGFHIQHRDPREEALVYRCTQDLPCLVCRRPTRLMVCFSPRAAPPICGGCRGY